MIHLIKEIISAEPFKLKLCFDSSDIKTVDFEPKLLEWSKSPGSKFKQLLDPEYFKSVKYNTEMESIYWDNGIDLSPNFLYDLDLIEA
ncbi:MAG: DUF2442 domain-containing protein [Ignavibacteria bacterium]|nr:DUF2442 domain-containing protein [Ignavibacteria bacterium]